MKQDIYKGIKLVNVSIDWMHVFVIINNIEIMINTDVNVKDWLTQEYVIKELFGILAIANMWMW